MMRQPEAADRACRIAIGIAVAVALASGCTTTITEPRAESFPSLNGTYYDGCNTMTCTHGLCSSTLMYCGDKHGPWVKQEEKP